MYTIPGPPFMDEERASYNSLELMKWVGIFQLGIFRGGFSRGRLIGGNFPGGNILRGDFPRTLSFNLDNESSFFKKGKKSMRMTHC